MSSKENRNIKLFTILICTVLAVLLIQKVKPVKWYEYKPSKIVTKYEERVDSILVETVKYKTKLVPKYDTIETIREKLVYYRLSQDTINTLKYQEKLIVEQDSVIDWQKDLITNLDTVIVTQAKANDILKDSIVELNSDLLKAEKKVKRNRIIAVIAGIGGFIGGATGLK